LRLGHVFGVRAQHGFHGPAELLGRRLEHRTFHGGRRLREHRCGGARGAAELEHPFEEVLLAVDLHAAHVTSYR
jgi:hypothetical protein